MDPRERIPDLEEAIRSALDSQQAQIWTALPGIIQKYDVNAQTVSVQPAIMGVQRNQSTGALTNIKMPLLLDCPVQFPCGGGLSITFPIAVGDECLVVLASRCIDKWWRDGGVQPQAEYRMHDLSDGFAFTGFRSKRRVLKQVSTNGLQLRTDDPEFAYLEITKDGRIIAYAKEGFFFTAPGNKGFNLSGDMSAVGTVRGIEVKATQRNISLNNHVHSGITVGGSNTNNPVNNT